MQATDVNLHHRTLVFTISCGTQGTYPVNVKALESPSSHSELFIQYKSLWSAFYMSALFDPYHNLYKEENTSTLLYSRGN